MTYLSDETSALEFHPVGLVKFGTDEKIEIGNFIVLSDQSRGQTQFAVSFHDRQHPWEQEHY